MNKNILPFQGKNPVCHAPLFIAHNAVIIGDTEIGAESSIWYGVVIRGDVQAIRIGRRTNIQDGSVLHVASEDVFPDGTRKVGHATIIGDNVTVGHMALLHACTIGDNCLIGMKACVMDGAVVENGAIVAAGALVTPGKKIPSGQLWAGSPARYVRDVRPEELANIQKSADDYWALAQCYS